MSELIRRTLKKEGTALICGAATNGLTFLSLVSFIGGPQQCANKAPPDTAVSAPAQMQTDVADYTQSVQASTVVRRTVRGNHKTPAIRICLCM